MVENSIQMRETKDTNDVHRSVFRNLLISMISFGVIVGLVFPPFAKLVLDTDRALTAQFFALCVLAGFLVGMTNYMLFSFVVSRDLRRVARGMGRVLERLEEARVTGSLRAEDCMLEVTSRDAIGEIERSFNDLTGAISRHLSLESATRRMHEKLSTSVELEDVSKALLISLAQVGQAKIGLLYGDMGERYELLADFGADHTEELFESIDEEQGPIRYALESGEILNLSPQNDGLEWVEQSTPLGRFRPKSILSVPLMENQRAVGLAVLALGVEDLTSERAQIVESLRTQGAPYLQTAVLHQKLKDLAALDDLTHILNRRFGLRRLREEFSRAVRHGTPVSIIMFDVDHFKAFNDDFGHDAGDKVLKMVANAAEANLRSGDVVCRYGGEEFMVVAPGTGVNDAIRLAERLRRIIETTSISWKDQMLSVTISAGVATWPMERVSESEELVSASDKALYAAKAAGRNQVIALSGEDQVVSAGSDVSG